MTVAVGSWAGYWAVRQLDKKEEEEEEEEEEGMWGRTDAQPKKEERDVWAQVLRWMPRVRHAAIRGKLIALGLVKGVALHGILGPVVAGPVCRRLR
jgi:hypothetical protein